MGSTSGSVYGNNVDGSEGSYLDWQLANQNASGNYSVINWQAGWRFSSTSCRGLRNGEASINGTTVYYDHDSGDGVHSYSSGHNHKPKLQTASGQITIYHDANGTKAFYASVGMTGWNGGPNLVSTGGASWWLPDLATVPPAPQPVRLTNVWSTSLHASFYANGDGGLPVFEWSIGYSDDPNVIKWSVNGSDSDIVGLTPGIKYYFWGRGRNEKGWGPWNSPTSATTLRVPDPPSIPSSSNITQTSVDLTFNGNYDGGTPITSYRVGYSTDSSSISSIVTASSPASITGLSPGITYYFWTQARNAIGDSTWAGPVAVTLIAGAKVNVGGVWKRAVPYVNVNGTWKIARPWSRNAGVWKESI